MPKGSWREFEDTSAKKTPQNSLNIKSKSESLVRVQKTRIGKGGKTVTVISGLNADANQSVSYTHLTLPTKA